MLIRQICRESQVNIISLCNREMKKDVLFGMEYIDIVPSKRTYVFI